MIELVNPAGDAENLYYKTLDIIWFTSIYYDTSSQCLFLVGLRWDTEQRHPTTVFCKNISSEKHKLPKTFYTLRKAKNFYMTVPFMYNFRNLFKKFPTIFWNLIFRSSLSRLCYFSQKKETQHFRIRKCDGKRNQKNSHFRKTLNCI